MKVQARRIYWVIGTVTTFGIGILVPPVTIIALILSISLALRPYLPSTFDRLALSLGISVCVTIIFAMAFWLLDAPLSPRLIFTLHGALYVVIMTYLAFTSGWRDIKFSLRPRLESTEVLAALLSVLTFILLTTPLLLKYDTNYIFQFFVFGGDNLTHLELSKVVEKNEGLLYGDVDKTRDLLTVNSTAYPQGLAFITYTLRQYMDTLAPINTPKKELYLLVILLGFFYSMMVYAWTRAAFCLVRNAKIGVRIFTVLLLGVVFLGPFLHFYTNGFQTHILSLFLFGMMFILAASLTNERHANQVRIALMFLLNVGISFTWLFLAPVSLTISGIIFLLLYRADIFSRRLLSYIKSHLILIGLMLLSVVACFVQVYVQLAYGIKEDSINEPGYVLHLEQSLVILSALAPPLLYLIASSKHKRKGVSKEMVLLIFSLTSTVFALLIYLYQVSTAGYPEYYYFKIAYHLILLGAVSLPAILATLLALSTKPRWLLALAFTFVTLSGVIALPVHLPAIINGTVNGMSSDLANAYGARVDEDPKNADNIVAVGSCNRKQDYLVTRLSGIQGDANTYLRQSIAYGIINDWSTRSKSIEQYQASLAKSGQKLIILDNDSQPDLLTPSILRSAYVFHIGTQSGELNASSCPSRYQGSIDYIVEAAKDVRPF